MRPRSPSRSGRIAGTADLGRIRSGTDPDPTEIEVGGGCGARPARPGSRQGGSNYHRRMAEEPDAQHDTIDALSGEPQVPAVGGVQGRCVRGRHRTCTTRRPQDDEAFWARQAAELVDWVEPWHTTLDWQLPDRQLVRRRHAQRRVQLPRPPRARRQRRPGRVPLGGRAGRHPHDHLRRPARRGAAVRQRAHVARRRARATGSTSTCR